MKVTGLEIIPISKYLFIRINTGEGIHGTDETGAWGFSDGVEGMLGRPESYLLGKNPFQIEHYQSCLYRNMYFRGSMIVSTLPAIDVVFWDIKGRTLGVSVYELLGGKCRDKVRSYEAVFCYTPEEMVEFCVNLEQKGYDAGRLVITGDITRTQVDRSSSICSSKAEGCIERVGARREAVGKNFDLILEYHCSIDPCGAIALAKGVETYKPLFLEDPIPPDSPEAMADAAKGTSISMATGERFIDIQEFKTILQKQAARHLRPDTCALGGLTPSKKVAAMAEVDYVKIMSHNPLGPVSTAACLQLDAAIPNFAIQEFPSFHHQGNEVEMTTKLFREEDGYIMIPDTSGIGIELVENLTEKLPPRQRSISVQAACDGGVYGI